MVKRVVAVGVLSGLLFWLGAAPAGEPEIPLRLITADELKALMDKKAGVDLIDVRSWDEYVKRHIKGARSMPIRAIPSRAHEIKKTGLAVFY
ncbi:MAG: rhodanese-like domain-containing protein [Candidatus Rokubacteria bacterium]|nr:rhodanese-like domain-containing protein [Candidatus Rokubacteria bacterium]